MVKKLLTQIKHKTLTGEEVVMDIGAKASNVLPENFVEQQERSNLTAKDKLPVIFGKLSKWYTDLKAVAWSGSYSDLTNKPTIPEGSAANYQVANNDTTEAEGFVADARIVRTHGLEIDGLSRDLTRVNVYVGGDGKLHFVNSGGADSVLPFSPDASAKIDKFISDSKYIDFFDSKTQNVSVVDGAQYLICDIGQYSSKIKFNSGCIINKTYTIPGNKQPDRVPSEYIITANSSTISVSGSSGAFFIRLK